MVNEPKIHKKRAFLLAVISSVIFFSALALLRYSPETPVFPRFVSAIKAVGDEVPEGDFVHSKENEHADLSALVPLAEKIIVPTQKEGDAELVINNPFGDVTTSLVLRSENNYFVRVRYDPGRHALSFVIPEYKVLINNSTYTTSEVVLGRFEEIYDGSKVVTSEGFEYTFDQNKTEYSFRASQLDSAKIHVMQLRSENLLDRTAASFEGGLWRDNVSDCTNKAPGIADIGMALSSDSAEGVRSLELFSRNHAACTNKFFDAKFEEGKRYLLSFKYRNVTGEKAQFYYRLNGEGKVEYSQFLPPSKDGWRVHQNIFTGNASSGIDIYFYAPATGGSLTKTRYDAISINEVYEYIIPLTLASESQVLLSNIPISAGKTFLGQSVSTKNILEEKNSSFGEGLWQETVTDCSRNSPGDPILSMSQSSNAYDEDGKSLELSSESHVACTSKDFPVDLKSDTNYLLTFAYNVIEGERAQVYYRTDGVGGKHEGAQFFKKLSEGWSSGSVPVLAKTDSNNLNIHFYAAPTSGKSLVLYDAVHLTQGSFRNLPYLGFEFENNPTLIAEPKGVFRPVSSWKYLISTDARDSWLLIMPKHFSKNARARAVCDNQNQALSLAMTRDDSLSFGASGMIGIPQKYHYKFNDWNDAWLIDASKICEKDTNGSLNIVIEYQPGKIFQGILLVSGLIFLASLVFIISKTPLKLERGNKK